MNALVLTVLLAAAPSLARTTTGEAQRNSYESALNAQAIQDDVQDRQKLASLINDWTRAWQRNARGAERNADRQIAAWISRELRENTVDIANAKGEVKDSSRELRQDMRDVQQGHGQSQLQRAQVMDGAQDLADDKSDLKSTKKDNRRTQNIAAELARIQPKFDRGTATSADYRYKSSLLDKLLTLASKEVQLDRSELAEDSLERQEDRRD